MSPLLTAWLIIVGILGAGAVLYLVAYRLLIPPRVHPAAVSGPDPVRVLRVAAVVAEYEWLACHSTECGHMERPHRRTYTELAVCTWCGAIATVSAPATPKES